MQLPERPPDLALLLRGFSPESMATLMRAGVQVEPSGKYLHWDELKRRKPPEELSHEQWWLGITLARSAVRTMVSLRASGNASFWFARSDSLLRKLHNIDRRMGMRLEVAEPALANEKVRDRYILSSLAEEAITSSQLEGASTTRRVAEEMLLTQRPPRTPGERMIANNFQAMSHVRELRDEPLSPAMIIELQRILTKNTLTGEETGRLRRPDENVTVQEHATGQVLHVPPPAEELPRRLEALCSFANAKEDEDAPFIHPVVRAVLLHFMIGYDHPFLDGNGRTARALFYWSLLRQKYWTAEFLSISRVIQKAPAQYSKAYLFTETDTFDATYFILHQLGVMEQAIEDLYAYLERKARQVHRAEKLLRNSERFNYRQRALLAHAVRHPNATYTIDAYRKEHGVVYQTARTDLLSLSRERLLTKRSVGKAFVFSPGPALRAQTE